MISTEKISGNCYPLKALNSIGITTIMNYLPMQSGGKFLYLCTAAQEVRVDIVPGSVLWRT
jgi:hypothetical protein